MKKLLSLVFFSAAASAFAASPYIGASAGYLIDNEEEFFAARIGFDVATVNTLTHSVELEVGYVSDSELGISLDLIPVLANYRFTSQSAEGKPRFFGGAGAGASRIRIGGYGLSQATWTFTAQAFVGVEFEVAPKVALSLNVRYIWFDEFSLFGTSWDIGDDIALEAGIRIRF